MHKFQKNNGEKKGVKKIVKIMFIIYKFHFIYYKHY